MKALILRVIFDAPICGLWCGVFHLIDHKWSKIKEALSEPLLYDDDNSFF